LLQPPAATFFPYSTLFRSPRALSATVGRLLRDVRFLGPTLVLSLNFGMMFTYISSFSFVSQNELGASPQTFALLFGLNAVGLMRSEEHTSELQSRENLVCR